MGPFIGKMNDARTCHYFHPYFLMFFVCCSILIIISVINNRCGLWRSLSLFIIMKVFFRTHSSVSILLFPSSCYWKWLIDHYYCSMELSLWSIEGIVFFFFFFHLINKFIIKPRILCPSFRWHRSFNVQKSPKCHFQQICFLFTHKNRSTSFNVDSYDIIIIIHNTGNITINHNSSTCAIDFSLLAWITIHTYIIYVLNQFSIHECLHNNHNNNIIIIFHILAYFRFSPFSSH